MPRKRKPAGLIGLGLTGSWIQLEPLDAVNAHEFARFEIRSQLDPVMGAGSRASASTLAPPMLIRDRRSGDPVGLVQNHTLPGSIAVFVVYLDLKVARAGFGFEAVVLYISQLFDRGARLVTSEVLEFNSPVHGFIRKVGLAPQARLREHVFTAGRFWDVLVYSMDRDTWVGIIDRYRRILPGGDRKPAAIGFSRSPG